MKIDLKKKSFAKGKNSGAKMKRFEYNRKVALKEGTKVKESKCYRCGEVGHWASQCTGGQGDRLIPEQMAEEFDPGDFPTLDQVNQAKSTLEEDKTLCAGAADGKWGAAIHGWHHQQALHAPL